MTSKMIREMENFIKKHCARTNGAIIGLSGGIDSTTVAYLAVNALGKDKVFGLCLPYDLQSVEDAKTVAHILDIKYAVIDIRPAVIDISSQLVDFNKKDRYIPSDEMSKVIGNVKARVRMTYLYMFANLHNCLVLGTTNRSEWAIGYFTKYGDGACDIEPIIHLYKREVKEVAKRLGVPQNLIDRTPSAELWPGQTDEAEFGFTYDDLEKYLTGKDKEISKESYCKIKNMMKANTHKRNTIPDLTGNWIVRNSKIETI